MNKQIMIGSCVVIIVFIVLVGHFLFYYAFSHTFNFLACKDIKEGLTYSEHFTGNCECKFFTNICYNTERTKVTFNYETKETIVEKIPIKEIFWKNGGEINE